jgi:hypothetical protein
MRMGNGGTAGGRSVEGYSLMTVTPAAAGSKPSAQIVLRSARLPRAGCRHDRLLEG